MNNRELKLYKLKDFRLIKSFFENNGKVFTDIEIHEKFLEENCYFPFSTGILETE